MHPSAQEEVMAWFVIQEIGKDPMIINSPLERPDIVRANALGTAVSSPLPSALEAEKLRADWERRQPRP